MFHINYGDYSFIFELETSCLLFDQVLEIVNIKRSRFIAEWNTMINTST